MTRAIVLAALLTALMVSHAEAAGPYPPESWTFKLEFRRMPLKPSCIVQNGHGQLEKTKSGRNPAYELTGFPDASGIVCTLPNGGRFEVDAGWYFDLPEDGFWKGTVELMGPGDIRAVRALYTYKNVGPFVEGTYWFDTVKGRIKQSGGSKEMYQAIINGARQ